MTKTGKLHHTRLMTAIMLLSLLSACALMPQNFGHGTSASSSAQAASGKATTIAKIIPARQEITPASSIEKNKLSISYSLKTLYGKHEKLLRLTLIFKNLADRNRHIWPHIALLDAQGKRVRSYSLKTLRRITSHQEADYKTDLHHSDQTSGQWADMYWIKRSYRIPSHGIVIGELIFHDKQLNFPMKLTVRIYKDYYRFTAEQ